MSQSRSKEWFRQGASLSQKLSAEMSEFADYAGTDPRVSLKLARLRILGQHGLIDMKDPEIELMWDLLNEDRKALFATSETTNEITKMGLMMPKKDAIVTEKDYDEDGE